MKILLHDIKFTESEIKNTIDCSVLTGTNVQQSMIMAEYQVKYLSAFDNPVLTMELF